MKRSSFPAMLLLLVLAPPAVAQFPAEVVTGARVRIVVPDSVRQEPLMPRRQQLLAVVAGIGDDTLYVAVPYSTGTFAVPRANVRQLSISRGVPSRGESALRRGLELAVTGALTFWVTHQFDDEGSFDSGGQAAAIGAGVGFGAGALLGAVLPSERWRRLRLRD